ncbi:MAG: TlpA family protein disulfide reductase [Flavobacteriales bacterium]|nr:TlpA family protein disulfide reductase [Flavobacteriales bacterium]
MKKILLLGLIAPLFLSMNTRQTASIPSIVLKDLNGNSVDTGHLTNDGKPIMICFWATWCSPCKKELNTYAEYYDDWKEETGVKIYAVTIDDQRTVNSVKPYVNSVSWDYDILLDVNKSFSQAMGVNMPPHTFILDSKGEVVWQHVGYNAGDEEEVHEQLLKLKQ